MNKIKVKRFARLLRYDFQSGIRDKVLLFIELVLCMVLVGYALTGIFTGVYVDEIVEDFLDYHAITISVVNEYDDNYSEELYNEQVAIIKQINEENDIGRIDIIPRIVSGDNRFVERNFLSYDQTAVEHLKVDVAKGSQLSTSYDGTCDVVLNHDYIGKYEIGDVVDSKELNLMHGQGFFADKLKVVGFLEKGALVYRPIDGSKPEQVEGVVSVPNDTSDEDYIHNSYIFNDIDIVEFKQKYNSDLFTLANTADGVETKDYKFNVQSVQSLYEYSFANSHEQILSFMVMFGTISVFILISSLMSIIVVKYGNTKTRNKLMVKMGSTKEQMLAIKLVNVAGILSLATLVAGLILPFITTMGGLDTYIFKSEYLMYSVLIAGGLYLITECAETVALYKSIKKEKS